MRIDDVVEISKGFLKMTPDQFAVHPNSMWVCDGAETLIIACNDAACRFLGQPPDSIRGLAPADLGLAAPDGLIHLGRPGSPAVAADLSWTDIDWDGAPTRLLAVVLHRESMAEAGEDSPAKVSKQMKRQMLHDRRCQSKLLERTDLAA